MKVFTIGFTQKTAKEFFSLLKNNAIKEVVDIRLGVTSQLAAFAKGEDLRYFLAEICDIDYTHDLLLAPTEELLKDYKKKLINWSEYEVRFDEIMEERNISLYIKNRYWNKDNFCLLCSEPTPEYCHRRLVAEIFSEVFRDVEIIHL